MEFNRKENELVIKIDKDDKDFLKEVIKNEPIETDNAMCDFFEPFLANSEFSYIDPSDISALTDAPILGCYDENENIIEAYGFMNYAVRSPLQDFMEYGQSIWQKG